MDEKALLREIEPQLQAAYEDHMARIGDRRPFSPAVTLAEAAGSSSDPLEYGAILREEHEISLCDFAERLGVDIGPVLAASFLVNLSTEENLPHYTNRILSKVIDSKALTAFGHEWTAEEATHSLLMRDYALLTGLIGNREASLISHAEYDAARTRQLRTGTEINPDDLQHAFAYLTLQEHLTKEAHNKLSWILAPGGRKAMRPISGDEQNHYKFYRKAAEASLAVDPDGTLVAMNNVYSEFEMPGAEGIPGFGRLALKIGISGIFDLESVARSKQVIVNKIGVADAQPTSDAGKQAQSEIVEGASDEAVAAQHAFMESLRDPQPTQLRNGLAPFILGRTVQFKTKDTPAGPLITGLEAIAA